MQPVIIAMIQESQRDCWRERSMGRVPRKSLLMMIGVARRQQC